MTQRENLDATGERFAAVYDHCLILRPQRASTTKQGIIIPERSQKPYEYGYCFAVGPKVESVAAGDWVLIEPSAARDIMFDNPNKTMFTVVPEAGVMCRLSTSVVRELELQMPQMDVIDVLSRTKETGVQMSV